MNGKQAVVNPDGKWVATGVPMTDGGVAIFDAVAVAKGVTTQLNQPIEEIVSIQTRLNTEPITLNLTQPACGIFQLRLTGDEGRYFVLYGSSNLVDWSPILTNRSSKADFYYMDTNTAAYGCRFFRAAPVN